jgi:hypothetical protein
MHRPRLAGLSVIAALALTAVLATPALAAENPVWLVDGTQLELGEGAGIEAAANGTQTLKATGIEINCKELELDVGAEIKGGEPGKVHELLDYHGCTVHGHELSCSVSSSGTAGEIETEFLEPKLAFRTREAAEAHEAKESKSVTVFTGLGGESSTFVTIVAKGSCGLIPSESMKLAGGFTATNIATAESEESRVREISMTGTEAYWTNPGHTEHHASLKLASLPATLTGKVRVGLELSFPQFPERYGILG